MPGLPFVNLILMCHSIPEPSRVALCKALKAKRPESPILMLYNGYDPTLAEVDGRLENLYSPEAFLDVVELLLSNKEATPAWMAVHLSECMTMQSPAIGDATFSVNRGQ